MEYKELLAGVAYTGVAPKGQVPLVTQDSRKVIFGAVFVCIKGTLSDGHDFAAKALQQGAGMIVSEHALGLVNEVVVPDARFAYAAMCQNFFGRPADRLTLVGVTGTNGKTTVTDILKQVLARQGVRCGLIGTVHTEIGDVEIPAKFTTPEPWDLHALLARMEKAGCTHVVMEASSQALAQGRLCGVRFALGVFTNLSRDHLDYHGDMKAYFEAKKILFAQSDAALINSDDEWGRRLLDEVPCPVKKSFSTQKDQADFIAHGIELRAGGVRFGFLAGGLLHPVAFPMPGAYSVANALAAGGAAILLGYDEENVAKALSLVRGVRGRCEVLYSKEFTVIRDFAHTADAMEKLLGALRPYVKGKMTVLYGCAGDRDPSKRADMSEAALLYGDMIILTSDNPRTEPPQKIFADALPPLEKGGKPYTVEEDRVRAIHGALAALTDGDMLVLCGKGHEDYQVLNGVTVYLDERQVVEDWLREKGFLAEEECGSSG